ncbi:MAG TPA: 6-bladed beta-propeller, partial [Longimicrobium sp.]
MQHHVISSRLILLLFSCAACADTPKEKKVAVDASAKTATFSELFATVDSVLLEQPDSAPIVRISGIDVDDRGRILIGDVSEGDVKLFAPTGELIRIIGRKGAGPGEFSAPRYPRFGPGGMIYV